VFLLLSRIKVLLLILKLLPGFLVYLVISAHAAAMVTLVAPPNIFWSWKLEGEKFGRTYLKCTTTVKTASSKGLLDSIQYRFNNWMKNPLNVSLQPSTRDTKCTTYLSLKNMDALLARFATYASMFFMDQRFIQDGLVPKQGLLVESQHKIFYSL
jgi:hypothetical protein